MQMVMTKAQMELMTTVTVLWMIFAAGILQTVLGFRSIQVVVIISTGIMIRWMNRDMAPILVELLVPKLTI